MLRKKPDDVISGAMSNSMVESDQWLLQLIDINTTSEHELTVQKRI